MIKWTKEDVINRFKEATMEPVRARPDIRGMIEARSNRGSKTRETTEAPTLRGR